MRKWWNIVAINALRMHTTVTAGKKEPFSYFSVFNIKLKNEWSEDTLILQLMKVKNQYLKILEYLHLVEKVHKQQGWPQAWEYCQAKLIQTLVRASQGVDWSWSQCIKSYHAQTSSGKGLPSHFWTRDNVRSVLPGLWRKITQWSKVLFSDESKFCISFGNQGPRVWRKSGEAQNPCCLKSSVKFPQSVMILAAMSSAGVGPLCFLKSTVNTDIYQEILEHFMLPSADKLYGDADFIF